MLNKNGDLYYDDVKNFSDLLDVEGLMNNLKITSANELRFFDKVESIGNPSDVDLDMWGFMGDTNITSVTLPPNLKNIKKIVLETALILSILIFQTVLLILKYMYFLGVLN